MRVEPVTLEGKVVRLEPLTLKHAEELYAVSHDPSIWMYMPMPSLGTSLDTMKEWIEKSMRHQQEGSEYPFAIIHLATGQAVGSTRYMTITPQHYGLEIGSTWLAEHVRRTAVNTECKYLLLGHAFEVLGAMRVQLKTDSRNLRSQRAIERLGAVKEGVLRNHVLMPDGYRRASVYYSILDTEWPDVKANLEAKLS